MKKGETLNLDQRLGLNRYTLNEESHIEVNNDLCVDCESKVCLTVCPAEVYKVVEEKIVANYENCLECGSCSIACESRGKGGIKWNHPQGGFGIWYRYG